MTSRGGGGGVQRNFLFPPQAHAMAAALGGDKRRRRRRNRRRRRRRRRQQRQGCPRWPWFPHQRKLLHLRGPRGAGIMGHPSGHHNQTLLCALRSHTARSGCGPHETRQSKGFEPRNKHPRPPPSYHVVAALPHLCSNACIHEARSAQAENERAGVTGRPREGATVNVAMHLMPVINAAARRAESRRNKTTWHHMHSR